VMPSVFVEWEVMSLLLPEIVQKCLHLRQKLIDHNFDVARAGGAFGADNFRAILLRRLEEIMTEATDLAGELGNVPVQNR
jgi:hypothetical protein